MEHHVIASKWFRNIVGKTRWKFLTGLETAQSNPIENFWCYRYKVAEKQPFSTKEFKIATNEVWVKEISLEYCASLVKSMM